MEIGKEEGRGRKGTLCQAGVFCGAQGEGGILQGYSLKVGGKGRLWPPSRTLGKLAGGGKKIVQGEKLLVEDDT